MVDLLVTYFWWWAKVYVGLSLFCFPFVLWWFCADEGMEDIWEWRRQ